MPDQPKDQPKPDVTRPFRASAARAAGITRRELSGPAYRSLFRGVYVDAGVSVTPKLRAQAALLVFPVGAFVSHSTAARLRGVPLPALPEDHVTVLNPHHRRRLGGVRCHVVPAAKVVMVQGVPTSPTSQMFVELAELLTLVDLVVVGDHLVRKGQATCADLRTAAAGTRGHLGRAARRAAALVRERVDSPMETRLRLLIVLAGIPEPEVNRAVRDELGDPIRRYDLSWPQVRVVVEYDGRHHIEREPQWESDLARREAMDEEGQRLLVVTAAGIYQEPGRTVDRVFNLLKSRGLAGLPTQPSDAWRLHFPERG